jgi:hypothetical protein
MLSLSPFRPRISDVGHLNSYYMYPVPSTYFLHMLAIHGITYTLCSFELIVTAPQALMESTFGSIWAGIQLSGTWEGAYAQGVKAFWNSELQLASGHFRIACGLAADRFGSTHPNTLVTICELTTALLELRDFRYVLDILEVFQNLPDSIWDTFEEEKPLSNVVVYCNWVIALYGTKESKSTELAESLFQTLETEKLRLSKSSWDLVDCGIKLYFERVDHMRKVFLSRSGDTASKIYAEQHAKSEKWIDSWQDLWKAIRNSDRHNSKAQSWSDIERLCRVTHALAAEEFGVQDRRAYFALCDLATVLRHQHRDQEALEVLEHLPLEQSTALDSGKSWSAFAEPSSRNSLLGQLFDRLFNWAKNLAGAGQGRSASRASEERLISTPFRPKHVGHVGNEVGNFMICLTVRLISNKRPLN